MFFILFQDFKHGPTLCETMDNFIYTLRFNSMPALATWVSFIIESSLFPHVWFFLFACLNG
jgi:hypothetical protein